MIFRTKFEKDELMNYKLDAEEYYLNMEDFYFYQYEWISQRAWHIINRKGFRLHKPSRITNSEFRAGIDLGELLARLDD